MINFVKPQIKLVGQYDGRMQAWRHSRPHLDPKDSSVNDIQNLDLPVNGFAVYHFEIRSCLLFRDLLYLVRPSMNWARSNRTTLITEDTLVYDKYWDVPEITENPDFIEGHNKSVDQSVNQDIRKSNFAYAVSTDYSFMCDARTLSCIVRSLLKIKSVRKYGELFKAELDSHRIQLVPGLDNFFDQYALHQVIDGTEYCHEVKGTDLVILTAAMTGNLFSQFERQAYSTIKGSLVNKVLLAKDITELPISQHIHLYGQAIMTRDKAIKLVRTRSCWFAQFDKDSLASWSHIIACLIKKLNLTTSECLICGGSHERCKWKAEQLARLKGGNPNGSKGETNPPCPILCGLPKLYELRGKKFDSNSELYKLWEGFSIGEAEPKLTPYGEEYLRNIRDYGFVEPNDNERFRDFFKEEYNLINDKDASEYTASTNQ